jgi:hypothetical protein
LERWVGLHNRGVKGGCFGRWNMLAFSCEYWFAGKDHMAKAYDHPHEFFHKRQTSRHVRG